MDTIWLVVLVIVLSGALGGLINSFLADPDRVLILPLWQHVIVGIGASFIIPLF